MEDKNDLIIGGFGGSSKPRTPREAPEGIYTGLDLRRLLSKSKIEVIDLLSEGKIEGLSSGSYFYSGVLGSIGWDVNKSYFIPNTTAQGTASTKYLQSIYWNETPIVDDVGRFNFQQVAFNYAKGEPNGSNVSDTISDELTLTRLINERLRGGGENFKKVYRILNKDCIAAEINVRVNSLSASVISGKKAGDTIPTLIEYSVYYKPVFSNKFINDFILGRKETIYGKVTAGYIRSTRITFNSDYSNDVNFLGWEIKIVRTTEDSTSISVRNQSFVDSLTEIYGTRFSYPNSAIASSLFDAEYFSSVPSRAFKTKLLKVKVPSNYNPVFKTYDESTPWSGTFKEDSDGKILKEWTDNPAWCYYDLLTNKRYGLGMYIDEDSIDKFTLYEIGKYCDTLVSDGYGGLEPRFTCNLYITSQDEAYRVINAMASIFRGITYYSAGQIYASQDSEKNPIYQFTNANVENGNFIYSTSSKKARHTVAIVRYNDKRDLYKPALEYVEDVGGIRKYGLRDLDVLAYGCTSRGQAIRMGRWALLTENLETEIVTFKTGPESSFLRPGDVFQIYDSNRKAHRLGGRVRDLSLSVGNSNITLDSELPTLDSSATYKLSLLTPTYYYDSSIVTGLNSSDTTGIRNSQIQTITFNSNNVTNISGRSNINVNQGLDYTNYNVPRNAIWLVEASGNVSIGNISSDEWDTYRVVNIKEEDAYKYSIEGLKYDVSKFNQIESGFSFGSDVFGNSLSLASPANLQLNSTQITNNSKLINYSFTIPNTTNIQGYRVLTKTSNFIAGDETNTSYIINELPNFTLSGTYLPTNNSTYYFRVYSVGVNGQLSNGYAENSINISGINTLLDINISSLQLYTGDSITNTAGTSSTGTYSSDSPDYTWQAGIQGFDGVSDLLYRITIRKPSTTNKPSNVIYYETTGYQSSEPSYTFNFDTNYSAGIDFGINQPFREYDIVVEAMNFDGFSSAGSNFVTNNDSDYSNPNGYDILYANNPKPRAINLFTGDLTSQFYQTGFATQQWLTQDGEVKIYFTQSGNSTSLEDWFGDDIAGGVLYYSNFPFTQEEAKGLIPVSPSSKVINKLQFYSTDNPIIIPAGLFNKTNQYISVAPYDTFDEKMNENVNNYLFSGLNLSNIVRIGTRNNNPSYKAWIEIEMDINKIGNVIYRTLSPNWLGKSFNIKDIKQQTVSENGQNYNRCVITFNEPLPTTGYSSDISEYRFIPNDGNAPTLFSSDAYPSREIQISSRNLDSLHLRNNLSNSYTIYNDPDLKVKFTQCYFIGIIFNENNIS